MEILLHSRQPCFGFLSYLSFTVESWWFYLFKFSWNFLIRLKFYFSRMVIIITAITSVLVILPVWVTINLRGWTTFNFRMLGIFTFMLVGRIFGSYLFIFFFSLKFSINIWFSSSWALRIISFSFLTVSISVFNSLIVCNSLEVFLVLSSLIVFF